MKTCFKCGKDKPRSDFYAHPQMADGLLGKCKECAKSDVHARYEAKKSDINAYDRQRASLPHRVKARKAYAKTERGKAAIKLAADNYARDRQKYIAHYTAGNAIKNGRLKRMPCEICGDQKTQAHHSDYSKPLEVTWLCDAHHKITHKTKSLVQTVLFGNSLKGEATIA